MYPACDIKHTLVDKLDCSHHNLCLYGSNAFGGVISGYFQYTKSVRPTYICNNGMEATLNSGHLCTMLDSTIPFIYLQGSLEVAKCASSQLRLFGSCHGYWHE